MSYRETSAGHPSTVALSLLSVRPSVFYDAVGRGWTGPEKKSFLFAPEFIDGRVDRKIDGSHTQPDWLFFFLSVSVGKSLRDHPAVPRLHPVGNVTRSC